MIKNEPTYFVGEWDENGEFWGSEYTCENKARDAYKHYCEHHPGQHIELIQQIKINKAIETHYPTKK